MKIFKRLGNIIKVIWKDMCSSEDFHMILILLCMYLGICGLGLLGDALLGDLLFPINQPFYSPVYLLHGCCTGLALAIVIAILVVIAMAIFKFCEYVKSVIDRTAPEKEK